MDADALRATLDLVEQLVEALEGQVRRAQRQTASAASLPHGARETIEEVAAEAARIQAQSARLPAALGAGLLEPPGPQPSRDPPESAGRRAEHSAQPTRDVVRALAIDLRLQGRSREEARERLERTFGVERAAGVLDEVFGAT